MAASQRAGSPRAWDPEDSGCFCALALAGGTRDICSNTDAVTGKLTGLYSAWSPDGKQRAGVTGGSQQRHWSSTGGGRRCKRIFEPEMGVINVSNAGARGARRS